MFIVTAVIFEHPIVNIDFKSLIIKTNNKVVACLMK